MEVVKEISHGVCAPKGFSAGGVYCGIKESDTINPSAVHKNDLGMIYSEAECTCAAVYTTNKVKGAPLIVTREKLEKSNGKAQAVIVNSKNANTCNSDGIEKARKMCEIAADELKISSDKVLVASTGIIGEPLPIEPIIRGISPLVASLSPFNNEAAATAIMTTDTVKKEYAVELDISGKKCRIGGMAKGSGMICPNMATTLNFITTDICIDRNMLQKALNETVKTTYNCLCIDGDMSTNDMVIIMANSMAGNTEITEDGENFNLFKKALYQVMMNLTKMLAKDGEGATKLIECCCKNANDADTASAIAKSVISSTLFKCAVFGKDANWGRILCAVGYSNADFDIEKIDVYLESEYGCIQVCKNGAGIEFSEDKASEIFKSDEITVIVDLKSGEYSSKAWGCDMTYDYVRINGDYRT